MPGGKLNSYISQSLPGTRFQMQARHTLLPAQETVWYFLETTGHFLLPGLAVMFCLPQIPSAASQSHDLLQGLLGSVAALLGKAQTNTFSSLLPLSVARSGSFHFPPNCPCSFSFVFFPPWCLLWNFFQCQSHIMCYPTLIINLYSIFHWLWLKPITFIHSTILFAITHTVSSRNQTKKLRNSNRSSRGAAFVVLQWGALVYTVLLSGPRGLYRRGVDSTDNNSSAATGVKFRCKDTTPVQGQ